jgi:hypothetical protein
MAAISFAKLRAELDKAKREAAALRPEIVLVHVENSPEGMGEREGLVCGVAFEACEGETTEAFQDRLINAALASPMPDGTIMAIVGVGPSRRAGLAAPKTDGATVAIEPAEPYEAKRPDLAP